MRRAHRSTDTVLAGIRRAGEWMLAGAAVAAALLAVVVPRVAGGTPYAVLTGSMRPAMPPGTLVVTRPVDPEDITTGQVITFMPHAGDPSVVTHRVVGTGFDGTGARTFTTQGDANDAPDPMPVRAVQVVGARWYSVPYLGYLTDLMTGRQRTVGIVALSSVLLAYALLMYARALRDRVRRPPVVGHA